MSRHDEHKRQDDIAAAMRIAANNGLSADAMIKVLMLSNPAVAVVVNGIANSIKSINEITQETARDKEKQEEAERMTARYVQMSSINVLNPAERERQMEAVRMREAEARVSSWVARDFMTEKQREVMKKIEETPKVKIITFDDDKKDKPPAAGQEPGKAAAPAAGADGKTETTGEPKTVEITGKDLNTSTVIAIAAGQEDHLTEQQRKDLHVAVIGKEKVETAQDKKEYKEKVKEHAKKVVGAEAAVKVEAAKTEQEIKAAIAEAKGKIKELDDTFSDKSPDKKTEDKGKAGVLTKAEEDVLTEITEGAQQTFAEIGVAVGNTQALPTPQAGKPDITAKAASKDEPAKKDAPREAIQLSWSPVQKAAHEVPVPILAASMPEMQKVHGRS